MDQRSKRQQCRAIFVGVAVSGTVTRRTSDTVGGRRGWTVGGWRQCREYLTFTGEGSEDERVTLRARATDGADFQREEQRTYKLQNCLVLH